MTEKITYDSVANQITQSVTKTQKDSSGNGVMVETRIDHNGAAVIAARRDPDFEAKLPPAVKTQIAAKVNADRADGEAAAAAALQVSEISAEDSA